MASDSFTPCKIDGAYVNTLVDFVNACREYGVNIDTVHFYQNGWHITFLNCPEDADAVCHDGSYGSPCYGACIDESAHANDWEKSGKWETIGFPWDNNDVSVHSSIELAKMIGDYQHGVYHAEEWE